MKKIIIILFFICTNSIYAQTNDNIEKPEFSSDRLIYDDKANSLELLGNVNFKTKIIEFQNAEKVVWDKNSNEIIASGLKEFSIDGSIILNENAEKKILRYKIGEKTAYVE